MKQTVRHNLMPNIRRVIAVVKELIFCHHSALARLFVKLLHHAVSGADHRQLIALSHHAETLLQIFIVGKHSKQQNDCGAVLSQ